ncbi:hypothetical protein FAM09_17255 [Niastella caeni]|uniref:Uncharacterized protein n=1 Tax=Niastella caeni TaxID=2569763 RepID=A0A4S8HSA3_9BACT|nr:hypothetical protein [Niastella caeni]THU38417.1 hypothetical protein FAM09_17255 [Niastella caeni]
MRITKKIQWLLFVPVLLVLGAIAVANTTGLKKWWNKQPETNNVATGNDKPDPVQVAMMNELMTWLQPFDSSNTSYYVNGSLTAIDKTDTAHALKAVPYTMCKNGQQFYLRIGQTETINNANNYLFIDHAVKKMLLSDAQKVIQAPGLPVNQLYDYIKSEGFVFSKTVSNSRFQTITMLNPNHISYKELSVQYDSARKEVRKIFIRQAEVTDPMNADKEKWLTLVVKDWNDNPEAAKYLGLQKFIQKKQDEWVGAPAFADYDLINQ